MVALLYLSETSFEVNSNLLIGIVTLFFMHSNLHYADSVIKPAFSVEVCRSPFSFHSFSFLHGL
jgi:hypothetical protein